MFLYDFELFYLMSKKLLIFIILLAVLIIGCQGIIKTDFEKNNLNQPNIEDCRNLDDKGDYSDFQLIGEKEICLANYGKTSNNYTLCNQEEEPYCMGGVAVNSKRLDICKDEACFLAAGLASDQNFCENAEYDKEKAWIFNFEKEARQICKFGVAISKKDKSICTSLDEQMRYFCQINLAKMTRDVSICESMEEGYDFECFFIVALEKKDKLLCKRAGERQTECENIIVKKRAETELNPNKCYQLEDYYDAAACVTEIAAKKSDIKLCDNLEAGFGQVRKECYEKVAMNGNKISDCEKLLDYPSANECYKRILDKNYNSIKLCEALVDIPLAYCVRNVDCEKSNDKARCLEFSQNIIKNNELFISPSNESVCRELTGRIIQKEQCFYNLAIEKNELSLCELSGSLANRCSKNILLRATEKDSNEIRDILKKRLNSSFNIGFSGSDGTYFAVMNNGKLDLYPSKFALYREFKLMTIDGCNEKSPRKARIEEGVPPLEERECNLRHDSYPEALFEVTYDGITVFVK